MKTYHFKFETFMPISPEQAWEFFSSPLNLAKITPADMQFIITSGHDATTKMYPGMFITYRLSPLWGIGMNWVTEITHVNPLSYFIDEQRAGPYAIWHHEHHFKAVDGGVQMTDILAYAIPYGIFGRLANALLVQKQVLGIFEYREQAIKNLFGHLNAV